MFKWVILALILISPALSFAQEDEARNECGDTYMEWFNSPALEFCLNYEDGRELRSIFNNGKPEILEYEMTYQEFHNSYERIFHDSNELAD